MAGKILEPQGPASSPQALSATPWDDETDERADLRVVFTPLWRHWRPVLGATAVGAALGFGASFLITPKFTSTTTFLPPQQQQSSAASALASIGALAGLMGGSVKSPAEQYISLMQSVTVSDRMIDRFKLKTVYDEEHLADARKELLKRATMTLGKKDGLISVAVEDESPRRAADMANQYVEELRRMTSTLAVSEAQQRRVFFEKQMQETKDKLVAAQTALQESGITAGALKADPRNAAEQYARLRAEATAAEVRLQTLRNSLADSAPEVQRQTTLVEALHSQIGQLEVATLPAGQGPDYIGKYREFKYQETLFDLLSKQYELARVDEAHEGSLIQVVDPALPAELKSWPKRPLLALGGAVIGLLLAALWLIQGDRRARAAPAR
jgi:uncharacterized protein involved in exopolysaccharide biosynthesis